MKDKHHTPCPLCDHILTWTPSKTTDKNTDETTHIYSCSQCPFTGFEYYKQRNLKDLSDYLNK